MIPEKASTVELRHLAWAGWLAGERWVEDIGVADAQLQAEETGGGGDGAVLGVGLLHRVAVLQGVNSNPSLIWIQNEQMLWKLQADQEYKGSVILKDQNRYI